VNLGSIYASAGRLTDAARLWERALESNPATEEAVLNSLFRATTVTGSGLTVEAIPIDRGRGLLRRQGRSR